MIFFFSRNNDVKKKRYVFPTIEDIVLYIMILCERGDCLEINEGLHAAEVNAGRIIEIHCFNEF